MWEAVRWLHLLAMAFFVGGQLVLAAAVVPAFRGLEGADREPLRAIARRFGQGTLVAIAVLVVTGAAMASHFDDWSSSTLQVKLGLVVLVGRPRRPAHPASDEPRARRRDLRRLPRDRVARNRLAH